MKRFLSLLLVLSLSLSYAKKDPYELDEVSVAELQALSCPTDAEADAFYHFDVGTIRFDYDQATAEGSWVAILERKMKIKILTKDGLAIANQIIDLYHGRGRVELENLKARTYNLENGKVEEYKMRKKNISREDYSENFDRVKYALPNVKVGSIIEIKYKLKSDFIGNLFDWEFQKDQPVLHSELTVTTPDFFRYNPKSKGFFPIQTNTSTIRETYQVSYVPTGTLTGVTTRGLKTRSTMSMESNSTRTKYFADSVPAFKEEPFISARSNYIAAVEFQLLSINYRGTSAQSFVESWQAVETTLMGKDGFGGYLNHQRLARQTLEDFSIQSDKPAGKITEIYMKLKQEVAWNGNIELLSSRTPATVLGEHSGSSAELNLLLISLLKEAGIQVYPVLISTRSHGYVDQYSPSLQQFNHVMAAANLDGRLIYLDLSGSTPPGILPVHSLNLTGRLMSDNSTWVNLKPEAAYAGNFFYSLELDMENKELSGTAQFKMEDFAAVDFRNRALEHSETEAFTKEIASQFKGVSIDTLVVKNEFDIFSDLTMVMDLRAEQAVQEAGNKVLVNPYLYNFVGENPFTGQERHYPIDFACPRSSSNNITLTIPEGYELAGPVKPVKIVLPDNKGSFLYQVQAMGNMVQISSQFMINESLFSPSDFESLKQFYALSLEKLNEPIVLQKT